MQRISLFIFLYAVTTILFAQSQINSERVQYKFDNDILYQSINSGMSWRQLPEISGTIIFLAWNRQHPEKVFAVTDENILLCLREKEKTWGAVFIPRHDNIIQEMEFAPSNSDCIWLATTEEQSGEVEYFISMNNGITWVRKNQQSPYNKLFLNDGNTILLYSEENENRNGGRAR
ncbi:MAG: hypothetical protein HYZ34_10155 [Ignavibacteriae bacterium]|nr:hypothetical protein [Ignavibacteriota bacterium]